MTQIDKKIEKMISFFQGISDIPSSEITKIRRIFNSAVVKKSECFINAGDIPDKVGFNISGMFRYYYIDKKGNEYTKYFALENDLLISYSASLLGEVSKFYIEALEDSEIVIASYKPFHELIEGNPYWDKIARKLIEVQYIKKEKREYQFLFYDAETRYKNFLEEFPGLIDSVKHYHIASYLGISPVSLSRIRKKILL